MLPHAHSTTQHATCCMCRARTHASTGVQFHTTLKPHTHMRAALLHTTQLPLHLVPMMWHRLLVDPGDLEYVCELGQGALSLVEKGRMRGDGKVGGHGGHGGGGTCGRWGRWSGA